MAAPKLCQQGLVAAANNLFFPFLGQRTVHRLGSFMLGWGVFGDASDISASASISNRFWWSFDQGGLFGSIIGPFIARDVTVSGYLLDGDLGRDVVHSGFCEIRRWVVSCQGNTQGLTVRENCHGFRCNGIFLDPVKSPVHRPGFLVERRS